MHTITLHNQLTIFSTYWSAFFPHPVYILYHQELVIGEVQNIDVEVHQVTARMNGPTVALRAKTHKLRPDDDFIAGCSDPTVQM